MGNGVLILTQPGVEEGREEPSVRDYNHHFRTMTRISTFTIDMIEGKWPEWVRLAFGKTLLLAGSGKVVFVVVSSRNCI